MHSLYGSEISKPQSLYCYGGTHNMGRTVLGIEFAFIVKKKRQTMCIQGNTETCLCNHCCSVKAINIIYSKCVSVDLDTQHAKHMGHVDYMWPAWL